MDNAIVEVGQKIARKILRNQLALLDEYDPGLAADVRDVLRRRTPKATRQDLDAEDPPPAETPSKKE